MLSASDTSVSDALSVFAGSSLEVCLLVPTKTGMSKSIMDATESVRNYLELLGVHNFGEQGQGEENKVNLPAYYIFPEGIQETRASLYRPNTKKGDPRIWFYGLKEYADPYNLLALLVHHDSIYVINCSKRSIVNSIRDSSTPLGKIGRVARPSESSNAIELLEKLREVSSLGYVSTVTSGDTGIGMTLQSMLGIEPDSSKEPDYKGIELKSKRLREGRVAQTRFTIFSQAPDWALSPIGSAWDLLYAYGYTGTGGKLRLAHQMDAVKPNSIGFMLELDRDSDFLKQTYRNPDTGISGHLVTWKMGTLKMRLQQKHNETFWVNAFTKGKGPNEQFHYVEAQHTRAPMVHNFEVLLEAGIISVDYTISVKDYSKQTVRDHGYLFKIHPKDITALVPLVDTYDLTRL